MFRSFVCGILGVLVIAAPPSMQGQSLKDVVRGAAERAVKGEVSRQVDKEVRKIVRCAVGDQICIDKAEREGNDVEIVREQSNGTSAADSRAGEGAWVNFDFVPGDRILFAEDFTSERVGNFPRSLQFVSGNMEIAELGGKRYLRSTSSGTFIARLPEALPEKFTIELEYAGKLSRGLEILTEEHSRNPRTMPGSFVMVSDYQAGIRSGSARPGEAPGPEALTRRQDRDAIVPVRLMADGDYVKVYVGSERVANVPNWKFPRNRSVQINLRGNAENPALIGNLRIAASDTSIYDALLADGRVATQGILFDTGSDVIRPESTPTLREIGEMLQRHGDMRLRIEGHTDNTGSAATNRALSERRAAAVRDHMIRNFGIAGSRLEAAGFGDTQPAAGNDTAAGRQQNRRVELVRL